MATRAYFDQDSGRDDRVGALRLLGFDALTAEQAGNRRLADPDQLEFATREHRILITANAKDFERIHREYMDAGKDHAGILIVLQKTRLSAGEFARRFAQMDTLLADVGTTNRVLYIQDFGFG